MEDAMADLKPVEVATMCGVTAATVVRWIRQGRIAAIQLPGGLYRIPSSEIPRIKRPTLTQSRDVRA